MRHLSFIFGVSLCLVSLKSVNLFADSKSGSVTGWVLDSACALTKDLKKPISPECAVACAKAGSPLAILDDKGVLYLPVSDAMPAGSQNEKLLPFAGKRVTATGKIVSKGGMSGIVISDVAAAESKMSK
jgi:hypothetical protein